MKYRKIWHTLRRCFQLRRSYFLLGEWKKKLQPAFGFFDRWCTYFDTEDKNNSFGQQNMRQLRTAQRIIYINAPEIKTCTGPTAV